MKKDIVFCIHKINKHAGGEQIYKQSIAHGKQTR